MPAAFLRKNATGGVFSSNVKVRSPKMVITTGIGRAFLELLGLGDEVLAELHDVETALAERRTDRRRRVSGTRRQPAASDNR